MSGNPRLLPDTSYVNGNTIPGSWWDALDLALSQSINGQGGGTWDPSASIVIAGAGVWACGPWSLGSSPAVEIPSGLDLVHGDSDWVGLGSGHAGASRSLRTSFGAAADTGCCTPGQAPAGTSTWGASTAYATGNFVVPLVPDGLVFVCATGGTSGSSAPTWNPTIGGSTTDGGVTWTTYSSVGLGVPTILYEDVSQGVQVNPVGASFAGGARFAMPLRVHNGATLTEVDVYLKVSSLHLPAAVPLARVVRVDMAGNCQPLYNGDDPSVIGYAGSGWLTATSSASESAYYAGGAAQFSAYPIDTAYEVIDTSKYAYLVQVIDESGPGAVGGNIYFEALAKFSAIPDVRPQ
ncbi:MAG TPA: hypothetical protein VGG39_08810 [Polyangiaceae bacterium]